jgi:hypothetical protein
MRNVGGARFPPGDVYLDPKAGSLLGGLLFKGIAERAKSGVALRAAAEGAAGSGSKACGGNGVEGTWAKAALLAASAEQGAWREARAGDQGTDALGTAELVGGEGDGVGTAPEGRVDAARSLNGIDMELGAVAIREGGELRDGLDGAGLVVDRVGGQEHGFARSAGGEGVGKGVEGEVTAGEGSDPADPDAAALQVLGAGEEAGVFEAAGEEQPPVVKAKGALDGEVVGLGATGGEGDVPGVEVGEGGDGLPGLLDEAAGVAPRAVEA